MTSRLSTAAPILAVLAIGLVIYISAYFALLAPIDHYGGFSFSGGSTIVRTPTYRIEGTTIESLFRPLSMLDQCIRPGYWDEDIPHRNSHDLPPVRRRADPGSTGHCAGGAGNVRGAYLLLGELGIGFLCPIWDGEVGAVHPLC
jgi:hypothetical protein